MDGRGVGEHRGLELVSCVALRPVLAHCRLGLGQAGRLRGDLATARAQAGVALAEYRAMAMPYWIARAEAQLAELG